MEKVRLDYVPMPTGRQPCRDCQNRTVDCHGTCAKYLEWREKLNSVRMERRRYNCERISYFESMNMKGHKQYES